MMHRIIVFLITGALVLGAARYYYVTEMQATSVPEQAATRVDGSLTGETSTPTQLSLPKIEKSLVFSWVMTDTPPLVGSYVSQRTAVSLKYPCSDFGMPNARCTAPEVILDAGVFDGGCSVIEKPESPNELTAVLCWFAGAGDEIGVFEEDGVLVLKKGEIGEGSPEREWFRGNFTTITPLVH